MLSYVTLLRRVVREAERDLAHWRRVQASGGVGGIVNDLHVAIMCLHAQNAHRYRLRLAALTGGRG